jgi:hypothetical protein
MASRAIEEPVINEKVEKSRARSGSDELGVSALHGSSFSQLLDHTVRLTAEGMQSEFCKVMDHIPTKRCFLVRAGVGWGRTSLV